MHNQTRTGRRRTVLIAPDSFKGSLTSVQVARALAAGWSRIRADDELILCPLADGGEGTLAAIEAAGGWASQSASVLDPQFLPVAASWLRSRDGRAYVEMAQASGLSLVPAPDRHPGLLTTFGTGQVIREVLDAGIRRITLGIGGSATNDGGLGILQALGARPLDEDGYLVLYHGEADPPFDNLTATTPAVFSAIDRIDLSELDPRFADTELEVACDVANPLLGPEGATAVYGPQKGITPDDQWFAEDNLSTFADALETATGRRERDTPGAGAAGGVGFGLLSIQDRFKSFALRPGIDLVMEATDFAARLTRADLVITGEGRIDAQTGFGKTALGVAKRAAAVGVACIAVGGGVEPDGIAALEAVGAVAVPVVERPMSIEEAMSAGTPPLERCGERLARLIDLVQ
jgi:glycerate kinase